MISTDIFPGVHKREVEKAGNNPNGSARYNPNTCGIKKPFARFVLNLSQKTKTKQQTN